MNYANFEVEDFAQDPSFRNYCLGTNETDSGFWSQWCTNNPDKRQEVEQAKQLVLLLSGGHSELQLQQDKILFQSISNQYTEEEPVNYADENDQMEVPVRHINRIWWVAASIIVLLVPLYLWYLQNEQTEISPYELAKTSKPGERKSFQLPDGSTVKLNAGSTIDIDAGFNTHNREVTLQGEAFFDVTHDSSKPFIIHTHSMDIRVLGTVFNVKAYPEDKITETSLLEGAVEITMKNDKGEKIILKPNQKIILPVIAPVEKQETQTAAVEQAPFVITSLSYNKTDSSLTEISWTENRLVLNDNSFEEVAAIMERWYDVDIAFRDDAVKQFRYTATFDQKTIDQVLKALQLSRHFEYSRNGDDIIISNK